MHADPNHPGLKKFREARAKDKAIAILRKEILENNPAYSDKQAQEIALAAYRAQNASRTIKVQGRKNKGRKHHGKGRRHPKHKVLSVQVEVVNKVQK
jgi:hypothetical protein